LTTATAAASAGLRELRIGSKAHMIHSDDIHQRTNSLCILQRRIGEMRPHTDRARGTGDRFGLLLANQPWAHHPRHRHIASQLRIKPGVRNDDRAGSHLERGLRGLHIDMRKIDQDSQPIVHVV
jgi:hypothetical protein